MRMDKVRSLIRSMVNEVWTDRPYGIAYTAAVVEDPSEEKKLETVFNDEVRAMGLKLTGWRFPKDHHMTICLGELPLHLKMRGDIGKEVELHVTHFGFSDKAMAFKVTGYMSKNDTQHITMAFREQPADAKDIQEWHSLEEQFVISANIREAPNAAP